MTIISGAPKLSRNFSCLDIIGSCYTQKPCFWYKRTRSFLYLKDITICIIIYVFYYTPLPHRRPALPSVHRPIRKFHFSADIFLHYLLPLTDVSPFLQLSSDLRFRCRSTRSAVSSVDTPPCQTLFWN